MKHTYKKTGLLAAGEFYIPIDEGYGILMNGDKNFVALILTHSNLEKLRKTLAANPTDVGDVIEMVSNAYRADRGLEELRLPTQAERCISDDGQTSVVQQASPRE